MRSDLIGYCRYKHTTFGLFLYNLLLNLPKLIMVCRACANTVNVFYHLNMLCIIIAPTLRGQPTNKNREHIKIGRILWLKVELAYMCKGILASEIRYDA